MTAEGAEALRLELKRLTSVERPRIVKEISAALAQGDLRENAEFQYAKEEQGHIEGRISEIAAKLGAAQIINIKGLSETVVTELNRALDDHELIKIRINSDRESRKVILAELVSATQATVVQTIGGIALIFRASSTPNPSLSNLVRHQ